METIEAAFWELENSGNNNLDSLVNLLQISNLIDESSRNQITEIFDGDENDTGYVDYDQFQTVIYTIAAQTNQNYNQVANMVVDAYTRLNPTGAAGKYVAKKVGKRIVKGVMNESAKQMELNYNQLKSEGKNSVDEIVKLLKTSDIIDDSEESEIKIREMFDSVPNKNDVEQEQFRNIIHKLALEKIEEIRKKELTYDHSRIRFKGLNSCPHMQQEMGMALENDLHLPGGDLENNIRMKNEQEETLVKIDNKLKTEASQTVKEETLPNVKKSSHIISKKPGEFMAEKPQETQVKNKTSKNISNDEKTSQYLPENLKPETLKTAEHYKITDKMEIDKEKVPASKYSKPKSIPQNSSIKIQLTPQKKVSQIPLDKDKVDSKSMKSPSSSPLTKKPIKIRFDLQPSQSTHQEIKNAPKHKDPKPKLKEHLPKTQTEGMKHGGSDFSSKLDQGLKALDKATKLTNKLLKNVDDKKKITDSNSRKLPTSKEQEESNKLTNNKNVEGGTKNLDSQAKKSNDLNTTKSQENKKKIKVLKETDKEIKKQPRDSKISDSNKSDEANVNQTRNEGKKADNVVKNRQSNHKPSENGKENFEQRKHEPKRENKMKNTFDDEIKAQNEPKNNKPKESLYEKETSNEKNNMKRVKTSGNEDKNLTNIKPVHKSSKAESNEREHAPNNSRTKIKELSKIRPNSSKYEKLKQPKRDQEYVDNDSNKRGTPNDNLHDNERIRGEEYDDEYLNVRKVYFDPIASLVVVYVE